MRAKILLLLICSLSHETIAQTKLDFHKPVPRNYYTTFHGQSNGGVGLAVLPAVYGLDGVIAHAKILRNSFGGTYEALQFGVNNQGNSNTQFGPELSFGKYLGAAVNKDVYISKYGVNGAALADVPGSNDFVTGGALYNTMVGVINNAVTALPASAIPYFKTFVWGQGERDGQGETGQPTIYSSVWASNFVNMIHDLEDDIGFQFDLIIICRLSERQRLGYVTTVTGFDQVVVQQNMVRSLLGPRVKIISTDNSYTFPTDAAHFNNHGANLNGVNVAKTILGEPILPPTPAVLKLHLDGKLGVTITSGKVSAWADQSGNGRNATQSNAALRPTYNGTDAITFNADGILSLTPFINGFKDDIQGEFIVVFERTNTLTPVDWIWGVSSSSSDNSYSTAFVRATASSHPDRIWPYKQNGVGAGSQLYAVDVIPASPFIFSVANNTYGTKAFQSSAHEVELDPSFGNVGEPNWLSNTVIPYDTFTIGGLSRLSGNLLSKFKIKAFIYYDRMLSYEERQELFAELTTYYSL